MKIHLLRHGETQAGRCFLGSTDACLSDRGWQQMEQAVSQNTYQKIISSPLKRCADFAQHLAKNKNILHIIEPDLREIHFGDWEAKTTEQLWKVQKNRLMAFWDDPVNNMPPNAESLADFQARVNAVFERLTLAENEKNIHMLVIAHGGVIRQIIVNILSIPHSKAQLMQVDYGSVGQIDYYDGHFSIGCINLNSQ